ncbi:vacuolar protein sorting 38 isoform X1 [Lactuca sativa]|uniref:UV radiation resistance-associated gene protein n=1 Tax=Lactuca sativa TaxID=4236 RepID=A0A9R1XVH0_LACSA|nr:vacuolar protein sorting 38 isoform X1 [Lactuca sativa]XP_052624354.1 vacuolar protein sorting 38 isoform X1 [Lactuca sativa]KAJ0223084.1 hypothetical protein LSAT_V11C200066200 [Lactuca sativa]
MESKKKPLEETNNNKEEKSKIIPWEDFQQELARLSSLSSALDEANQKKSIIREKLNSFLQLEAESIKWSNELDEMREKLEARKLLMGNMSMRSKAVREKTKKQEEQLNSEIRSLLMVGSALSVATSRLQEANKSLRGEKGYAHHLQNLQKLLRMQQQFMVSQISLLYPVKVVIGHTRKHDVQKSLDATSMTILGHLSVHPFTKMNFLTDKKEALSSATALGYIAHAVSLLALYIKVPLRYPIRLGASRTYICDYTPPLVESIPEFTSTKPIEFPLFLEGKETTRSAYAVFLLNKDLEQLLNFIGVESLGPRHVLANFRELLNNILSHEYINS